MQARRQATRMADEGIGGYSFNFIESPLDEFVCLICHLVTRNPQQLLCCGKLCCNSCLQESKKHTDNCPQCRKRLSSFQDIRGDRAIKRLRVECDNHCNGYEFVGELGQHEATCDFSLLPCPNKCTDQHNKTTTVLRKDMEKHAMECPKRPYECPHCKETGDYQERTTKHLQECAKMEDVCPNEGCTERALRCDLPKHRQECPRRLVLCKYAYLGCDVTLPREEMTDHQKTPHHYQLQHECKYIEIDAYDRIKCIEFKDGSRLRILYQCEDKLKCTLHSPAAAPPWYSRTITLEMFNQLEDNNHFQRRFTLGGGTGSEGYCSLPFLGHNSAINCQYLKDGILYLRVSTSTTTASKKATVSD